MKLAMLVLVVACGAPSPPAPRESAMAAVVAPLEVVPPRIVKDGALRSMIEAPGAGMIETLAITPDGKTAITSDELGGVRLWPTLDGTVEPRVVDLAEPKQLAIGPSHANGFTVVALDEVGGLVIANVDLEGRTHSHVTLGTDPPFAGVDMTELGALAWRSDQTIALIGDDGVTKQRLGTEPGQRLITVDAVGRQAVAIVETVDGDKVTRRLRRLVLEPQLAWGPLIGTGGEISIDANVAVSSTGKRVAIALQARNGPSNVRVFEIATGKLLRDVGVETPHLIGFADDDHLAVLIPSGVSWLELVTDGGKTSSEALSSPIPNTSSLPVPRLVVGGGHVVIAAAGELFIATPTDGRGVPPAGSTPEWERGSVDGRGVPPAGSTPEWERGSVDGRGVPPAGSTPEWERGSVDGRGVPPAGSTPEWERGSVDGRGVPPAGSTPEWERGSVDGRGVPPAGSTPEWERGSVDGRGVPPAGSTPEWERGSVDGRFLGYGLASASVAAAAPDGELVAGLGETFVSLDATLHAKTDFDLGIGSGANLVELHSLGSKDWLVESASAADGAVSVSLAGTDRRKKQLLRSGMGVVQLIMADPTTQLVTLSLGDTPEIDRYDPKQRSISHVATLAKNKGYEQTELVPVSPSLAGGIQLIRVSMRDKMTVQWLRDPSALGTAESTATIEGSLAGADAAGHIYAWRNSPAGQLELVVYRDGKPTAVLPHDGPVALWPEPTGTRIIEIGQHSVAMYTIDGTRVWTQPLVGATEALWLSDGAIAIVSSAGIVRLDAMTGTISAARCGWKFGLDHKPHPQAPRIEPLCAQLGR